MSAVLSSTPYRVLTEKIIEAMKGDLRAFKMPWHTGDKPAHLPMNASTDAPYRGVNVLSLWISAMQGRYPSGYWASYKQWQSVGAQVRKGERGSQIIFYKPLAPGEACTAEDTKSPRFVVRASHVFNSAQVEGWTPPELPSDAGANQNEEVDAFVAATGARVRYGFHKALYRRDLDDIEMPSPA